MNKLVVSSLNITSLRKRTKDLISICGPTDVLCLQETSVTSVSAPFTVVALRGRAGRMSSLDPSLLPFFVSFLDEAVLTVKGGDEARGGLAPCLGGALSSPLSLLC